MRVPGLPGPRGTAYWGGPVSTPAAAMYALLTDGTTVEVRPARAEDAEAVRAMHAALSPDNMYLRSIRSAGWPG